MDNIDFIRDMYDIGSILLSQGKICMIICESEKIEKYMLLWKRWKQHVTVRKLRILATLAW